MLAHEFADGALNTGRPAKVPSAILQEGFEQAKQMYDTGSIMKRPHKRLTMPPNCDKPWEWMQYRNIYEEDFGDH